jgi:hypothetical protein
LILWSLDTIISWNSFLFGEKQQKEKSVESHKDNINKFCESK